MRASREGRPALEVIAAYGAEADALLYCDPPYLASTRTGTNYAVEMPSEAAHRELAEALKACRSAIVLSAYPSPLYDELYDGWYRHEIAAATGQAHTWAARTEVLWSNRPFPARQASLFDVAAAGGAS